MKVLALTPQSSTAILLPSIYDYDLQSLQTFLVEHECPPCAAKQLFEVLYKKKLGLKHLSPSSLAQASEGLLADRTRRLLTENFSFQLPQIVHASQSSDETVKFLIRFFDGHEVETVLVPFQNRYTVCLSTQVGCAMKCSFCYTGTQGLKRHLLPGEIVTQYLLAWCWLEEHRPAKSVAPKIVFMGQGEPLHNFSNVKKAIEIIIADEGIHLGPRQITLSTAGYLPGLLRFSELHQVNLALSLHSVFNDIRSELIPLNKTYDLQQIFQALKSIPLKKRQYINFEYLLIDGLNDRPEDVLALQSALQDQRGIVNIIPFNEFPGCVYKRPTAEKIDSFRKSLSSSSLYVTIRTTKGNDILAACGQLKVAQKANREGIASSDLRLPQQDKKC